MKKPTEHTINNRILTTYNSIAAELKLDKQKNYLFDLSYLGVIDLIGETAPDFLQGQLTCDINQVSDIQMIQGVQCNLKGRILSLLDVVNWNGLKLVLPKDLIEPTINSLTKTAQLSRVSLTINQDIKVFGLYVQNPADLIPDSLFLPKDLYAKTQSATYCYYSLGNGFYIYLVPQNEVDAFCKIFIEQEQIAGSLTWHTLRLSNKQVSIYPESRAEFLPHRLGLQETPLISFNKGCYKGQEIIARTHYRATLKHELRVYAVATDHKISSGKKVFKANENSEIAEVIDYSYLGNNEYLVALSILKEVNESVEARFEGTEEILKFSNRSGGRS